MNNANKSTLNPNQISTALWTLFAQIFAFKSLKNPSLNFSCFQKALIVLEPETDSPTQLITGELEVAVSLVVSLKALVV